MQAPPDDLAVLAPFARAPSARTRLGVGAAIVLFLAALVIAVVISALGSGGSNDRVPLRADGAEGGTSMSAENAGGSASGGAKGDKTGDEAATIEQQVFVHVLGAVSTAGLYELSEGSRVIDVVAAAGGFAEDADPAGVNLARLLTDGEQLYVPRVGEVPPPVAGVLAQGSDAKGIGIGGESGLVNLNTSTQAELETLPRIGPSLAQRILDWREANGGFASVDDLRNVTGIGEKTFDGLREFVTV